MPVREKASECIKQSVEYLKEKQVDTIRMKDMCIDMSPAFIAGCMDSLPEGEITFEKFHVVKEVNRSLAGLRKPERKGSELLKGYRYTFLKGKLSHRLQTEKAFLPEMYTGSGQGYRLKEMFEDLWRIKDIWETESCPAFRCDFATDFKIQSFIRLTDTVKAHWKGIVNYIRGKNIGIVNLVYI
jgi:transposase